MGVSTLTVASPHAERTAPLTTEHAGQVDPHAVTGASTGSFAYGAVGNQTARPGGTTVRYTPFDLPERITQGASTITFGYDGDQQRIRKTTPEKETLYFGDLYERVTAAASGTVEHRYHVHSPERVIAIVTRGGPDDGTRYVHVDHLGSVDALTDEDGDKCYPGHRCHHSSVRSSSSSEVRRSRIHLEF
ncbi:hypothetical protein [Sorangium sp. So ce1182]|uniref:hypothetical protein n=1 Tax=Sorangium sp. So ce1182 TaxID=3133334 RepID=UPI003F5ECAC6